jgi:F0F1-type ATP synthase assembly protein I
MKEQNTQQPWWKPGVIIFARVSASVAIPVILALFIGKYLDTRYGTAPWIFLGLTAIAFLISLVLIWKNVSRYMDTLAEEKEK